MSDAYEDDLANEQAIFDRIETVNTGANDVELSIKPVGRPHKIEPIKLVAWRQAHKASIAETAKRWSVSEATVKRFCRDYSKAAEQERIRWQCEQLDRELAQRQYSLQMIFFGQLNKHLSFIDMTWFGRLERAKGTGQEAAIAAARDAALAEAKTLFRENWERSIGPVPDYSRAVGGGA